MATDTGRHSHAQRNAASMSEDFRCTGLGGFLVLHIAGRHGRFSFRKLVVGLGRQLDSALFYKRLGKTDE